MSFQFPANPKDGDIVVQPTPDGGFIKGTYREQSRTWEVGELPEEPGVPGPEGPPGAKGEKGDPGKGMAISGLVDTYDDLPSAGLHPLQFWIVDDVNKVYYSDGNQWYDQGGPIQGPQGEGLTDVTAIDDGIEYKIQFEGTTPELDLTTPNLRGATGAPGKGWNSTTIIDERPDNYQIRFNSDDGLEFTTDNIQGPPGDLEVASENNIGGIKIGRGLNILPDGTLQAGETYVDLETVPLGPDGRPDAPASGENFSINFIPAYFNQPDNGNANTVSFDTGPTVTTSGNIQVPKLSNGAIVYFFAGSSVSSTYSPPGGYGLNWTVFAHLVSTLRVSGATFVNPNNSLGIPMTHNYSLGDETRRYSEEPSLKIGQITYPFGTETLGINVSTELQAFQRCRVQYGRCRIIVVPYKDGNPSEGASVDARKYFGAFEIGDDFVDQDPPTPEEIASTNAANLKRELTAEFTAINNQLIHYKSGAIYDELESIREELYALQELPGTYEEIYAEFTRLAAQAEPYTSLNFRFE
jgi:hypothetical protein